MLTAGKLGTFTGRVSIRKKNERIGRKVEEREQGRATGGEEAGAEHQKETKRKCYRFLLRNEKVHQVSNTTVQFPIQEAI